MQRGLFASVLVYLHYCLAISPRYYAVYRRISPRCYAVDPILLPLLGNPNTSHIFFLYSRCSHLLKKCRQAVVGRN